MAFDSFKQSESLSLGVELELQLINTFDMNLSNSASDLLDLLGRKAFPGQLTPEITESMIEIATGVHTHHDSLQSELQQMQGLLLKACDRLNLAISGGGTHPFQRWDEQRIFAKPRFRQISQLYGYLAQQFTVFGQHVHVGCRSADEALFLLHALNRYVPQFIAIAASSPFFQGVDTQFHSARLNSVFAFPLSGRAPFASSWEEFTHGYLSRMKATGIVESMKDFYWDIRPKPEYGTIELRVCDTPLTFGRAAAIACYLQALCAMLLTDAEPPPTEEDYLVYTFNRFQACRFGLDGVIVNPKTYKRASIREDLVETLTRIKPFSERLGSQSAYQQILDIAIKSNNDATYLRERFASTGSNEAVVHAAIDKMRERAQ